MSKFKIQFMLLSLTCLLTACGEHEPSNNASQVAAKVNGNEITVHRVNEVLQSIPQQKNHTAQSAANIVLDRLINEQVLVEQAEEMKIHRDPAVLSKIESAKQKVLIEEYIQRILGQSIIISDEEIKEYFNENPTFFAERKLFSYSQIFISSDDATKDDLKDPIEQSAGLKEFLNYLDDNQIQYLFSNNQAGGEQVQEFLREPLNNLLTDRLGYLTLGDGILVLSITKVVDAPIAFEAAKPAIQNFLNAKRLQSDTQALVKKLREQTVIEYVGDFSAIETEQSRE